MEESVIYKRKKQARIVLLLIAAVSLLCVYMAKQDKIKSTTLFHTSLSINSWPEKSLSKLDQAFLKISAPLVHNYYQGFTVVSFISEKAMK